MLPLSCQIPMYPLPPNVDFSCEAMGWLPVVEKAVVQTYVHHPYHPVARGVESTVSHAYQLDIVPVHFVNDKYPSVL